MGLSLAYYAWLRSGEYAITNYGYSLKVNGGFARNDILGRYAVRPALLDCNKLKKAADIPHFWGYRSHI